MRGASSVSSGVSDVNVVVVDFNFFLVELSFFFCLGVGRSSSVESVLTVWVEINFSGNWDVLSMLELVVESGRLWFLVILFEVLGGGGVRFSDDGV